MLLEDMFDSSTFNDNNFKEWLNNLDDTKKKSLTAGEALSQYKTHLESVGKTTSVTAKAMSGLKSIGGTILSTAGNMIAGALIAEAISLAIKGIYNIIKADEIAIEKGEEASQAIKETFDAYNSKVTTVKDLGKQFSDDTESIKTTSDAVDALSKRYVELSKGVGKDNSKGTLSTAEYQEYLDISNKLAESFPSLVSGTDAAGNSILNLGDNAAIASGELERLLKTQMTLAHNDIVQGSKDTFKGAYTEASGIDDEIKNLEQQKKLLDESASDISMSRKEIQDQLKKGHLIFEDMSKKDANAMEKALGAYVGDNLQHVRTSEVSLDGHTLDRIEFTIDPVVDENKLEEATNMVESYITSTSDSISAEQGQISADIVAQQQKQKQIWDSFLNGTVKPYLETSSAISDIPAELLNAVENNLPSIDWSKLYEDYNGDADKMLLDEFVSPLSNLEKPAQDALVEALTLDPSKVSIDEYEKAIDDALKKGFDKKADRNEWKDKFFKSVLDEANETASALKEQFKDSSDAIDKLTGEDRELAYQVAIEDEDFDGTWKDVMSKVKEMKAASKDTTTFSMSAFVAQAGDAISLVDKLNAALANSYSGKGLNVSYEVDEDTGVVSLTGDIAELINAYQDLDGYDPATLFEKTANGVHINREALRQLQAQEEALQKASFLDDQKLLTEKLTAATKVLNDAQNSGKQNEIITAQQKVDELQDQLTQVQLLENAYDGATSAYQKWLNAQSSGEEGDMFRSVSETMKERGDQLYQEGRYNTEEFRAIADYFSYEDLSTAPMEKLVEAYQQASNARDAYFTGNKQGIDNFMADMNRIAEEEGFNWIKQSEDGMIEFETGADKQIAERFNLSVEAVQALMRAATEYNDKIKVGDTSGNVDYNSSLEEMKSKADEAKQKLAELKEAGQNLNIDFNFESTNIEDLESQIQQATSNLDQFKNEDNVVDLSIEGAQEAVTILQTLIQQKQIVSQPGIMTIDTSGLDEDVSNVVSKLQEYQSAVNELSTLQQIQSAGIPVDTSELDSAQEKVNSLFGELQSMSNDGSLQINPDVSLDTSSLDSLNSDLASLNPEIIATVKPSTEDMSLGTTANATVNYTKGSQEPPSSLNADVNYTKGLQYEPEDKDATVNYQKGSQDPPASPKTSIVNYELGTVAKPPSVTVKVNYDTSAAPSFNGTANAQGTAYASGTAYKSGDWGAKKSEKALVGELGEETIVRNGKFFTVGEHGAEFANIKAGDIIFNHKQSEELFKNGHVTSGGGRAKVAFGSHAEGTAYSNGTWVFGNTGGGNLGGSGYTPPGSGAGYSDTASAASSASQAIDNATDSAEEFSEELDYIEIAIDRIERQISEIERIADSAFETFSTRNDALRKQISAITSEISTQQAGYERYIQAANSVGLSEDYAQKIRDGVIDLETITDETLHDSISQYKDYYEKALDCRDAVGELTESVRELYQQEFENVVSLYDNIIDTFEHQKNMIESSIDQMDAQGMILEQKSAYLELIATEEESLKKLNEKRSALVNSLNTALSEGNIQKDSEAYYDMQKEINDVDEAIQDATTSIIEFKNEIKDLYIEQFDSVEQQYDNIVSLLEHRKNMIDSFIDQSEAEGFFISEQYYTALIGNEQETLNNLTKKREDLLAALQDGMKNGGIKQYSNEWYEKSRHIIYFIAGKSPQPYLATT